LPSPAKQFDFPAEPDEVSVVSRVTLGVDACPAPDLAQLRVNIG